MENASKALIIAGAILLSILIIALGMRVYNSASSSAESSDLSSQEISSHNAQFEAYEGRQKGTQVKTLINAIKVNNQEYPDKPIEVNFKGSTITDLSNVDVKSSTTYKVVFGHGGAEGSIDSCTITIY